MQAKSILFENGARFKCDWLDIKEIVGYINAKHSGLYSETKEHSLRRLVGHCSNLALAMLIMFHLSGTNRILE